MINNSLNMSLLYSKDDHKQTKVRDHLVECNSNPRVHLRRIQPVALIMQHRPRMPTHARTLHAQVTRQPILSQFNKMVRRWSPSQNSLEHRHWHRQRLSASSSRVKRANQLISRCHQRFDSILSKNPVRLQLYKLVDRRATTAAITVETNQLARQLQSERYDQWE